MVEDWHAKVCLLGVCVCIYVYIVHVPMQFTLTAIQIVVGHLEKVVPNFLSHGCWHTLPVEKFDQQEKCIKRHNLKCQCLRGLLPPCGGGAHPFRLHDHVRDVIGQ